MYLFLETVTDPVEAEHPGWSWQKILFSPRDVAAFCRGAARQRRLEGKVQESAELHLWVRGLRALQTTCGPSELSSESSPHAKARLTTHQLTPNISIGCFWWCWLKMKSNVLFFVSLRQGLSWHHPHAHGLWLSEKNPGGRPLRKPHRTLQRCSSDICQC